MDLDLSLDDIAKKRKSSSSKGPRGGGRGGGAGRVASGKGGNNDGAGKTTSSLKRTSPRPGPYVCAIMFRSDGEVELLTASFDISCRHLFIHG